MSGLSQQLNRQKQREQPNTITNKNNNNNSTTTVTTTSTAPTTNPNLHSENTTAPITVYGAASGIVITLHLSATDSVQTLQENIALSLQVEPPNQILLLTQRNKPTSGGSSWVQSPTALLETYRLPSPDLILYLFDRRLLSRRSSAPENVKVAATTQPVPIDSSTVDDLVKLHVAELAAEAETNGPDSPAVRRPSLSGSGRSSVTFASLQATLLQFELHLRQVKICKANGIARFHAFVSSIARQKVSLQALDVATKNLNDLMDAKSSEFQRLWKKKDIMMKKHRQELTNFSTCLERLKQIPLHPALERSNGNNDTEKNDQPNQFNQQPSQTSSQPSQSSQSQPPQQIRKTLWDCVPVSKLQSWADDCQERDQSLRNGPAPELERTYKEVLRSVQDDILSSQSVAAIAVIEHRQDLEKIEEKFNQEMGTSNAMISSINTIVSMFEKDYNWIKNVVLSGVYDGGSASSLAKEAIDRGEVHVKLLHQVSKLSGDILIMEDEEQEDGNNGNNGNESVGNINNGTENNETNEKKTNDDQRNATEIVQWNVLFQESTSLENNCRRIFHSHLRTVSEKQHSIAKKLSNKMSAFHAQLKAQDKNIDYLVDVRRVPKVYIAFLVEIARRRRSTAMLKTELRTANVRLNRIREQEMEHRETFIRRHGRAVVADLVPAVANVRPMSIDVRERPSNADESLPNIDLDQRTIDVYTSLGDDMALLIKEVREESIGMEFVGDKEGGGGDGSVHSEKDQSGIPSKLYDGVQLGSSSSREGGGKDGNGGNSSSHSTFGNGKIDWERRCIELECRNAQLRASIVSDNIGHNERKLGEQKILKQMQNGNGTMKDVVITREEDGRELQSAIRAFPSLMLMLNKAKEKEKTLILRLKEVEATQSLTTSSIFKSIPLSETKENDESKDLESKNIESKNIESKNIESKNKKDTEMKELLLKLEDMKLAMESEQMESKRLRKEVASFRSKYENEQKGKLSALQESQDVQVLNKRLVVEHQELLTASQTSTKSSEDRDRHVEELTASVRNLRAHSEELIVKKQLLDQTTSQLTDQILNERKRHKRLMNSSIFWKATDVDDDDDKTDITDASLEVLFQSVLQEGIFHLMFYRHTSGELFEQSGGGCHGRDCLYIAVLPRRQDENVKVRHCVLSNETVLQLANSNVKESSCIVAKIVELIEVQVNEKITVFVATAGEIFHPKLL